MMYAALLADAYDAECRGFETTVQASLDHAESYARVVNLANAYAAAVNQRVTPPLNPAEFDLVPAVRLRGLKPHLERRGEAYGLPDAERRSGEKLTTQAGFVGLRVCLADTWRAAAKYTSSALLKLDAPSSRGRVGLPSVPRVSLDGIGGDADPTGRQLYHRQPTGRA